jgi:ribosome-binding protein aMBF1 (putative translation factor)
MAQRKSNTASKSQPGGRTKAGGQTAKQPRRGASSRRQPRSRFSDEYGVLLKLLIAARQSSGVTQEQIAERLGKTQSHVSMCENREREISIMDLWRWCDALGIQVSDFMQQFERAVGGNLKAK